MELSKALDSAVSEMSDVHSTAADASHDAMSIETVIHPDESNSATSESVLTMDVPMESELIDDALIGIASSATSISREG